MLSSDEYAKRIIRGDEVKNIRVAKDESSERFDKINQTKTSIDFVEECPQSDSHNHTDDDIDLLLSLVNSSERYKGTKEQQERIIEEIDYFYRTKNITFVIKCLEIIEKFKSDNIVWGVGRGSSCASFLAYVLYINDIDPLKYDIPFSELSKETFKENNDDD